MIRTSVVTISTAVTIIDGGGDNIYKVGLLIKNPSSSVTVYIGGSDVDTTIGYPIGPGETLAIDLGQSDALYGRVAASTQTINVIRTKS